MVEVITKLSVFSHSERNLTLRKEEKFLIMRESGPECYIARNNKVYAITPIII